VLGEEITGLEMELREAAVRSGELAVTAAAQPNGVSVQLGSLVLVLVESTWGWLGRDDQVLFPMVTEVEIHEQVSSLWTLCAEGRLAHIFGDISVAYFP
jgi:hypothetical protein